MTVFRKDGPAPAGYFGWEAAGLRWLHASAAVPVAKIIAAAADHLLLEQITSTAPTPAAAHTLGRQLAHLHNSGAPAFGSPPPQWNGPGWFGPASTPMQIPTTAHSTWGRFYAENRLTQLRSALQQVKGMNAATDRDLERLTSRLQQGDYDDDDRPARLHGDLWSGNVMWSSTGAILIDPAAHGGHRENDIAMAHLFGFPFLDQFMAGYQQVHPLRNGWEQRLELHQLFAVGVHAVLFGGKYLQETTRRARYWAHSG